ncbi:hypothetical protein B1992_06875 [Pseudoxanthomonas broegbernensis]|uniref:Uncharacterized protein n=1 Tax=Pseudoxanthomonas broegbernensis TaxID=83619 RepID=A0A7V8K7K9_9GAMM|nr:hypothetical protein [Pseudoxanthomonas broegbernensis]KAF1686627.1 hypothetical protein B1992_06875 [Pseudoxanthomonas broegbernensis]MBB6063619.1 hypothetical protein [Pseudoxanthomonas broegbernensis]
MNLAASPLAAQLRRQLDATPWLRWALLAIAALAALLVLQGLEQVRTQAQKQAIDEEVKLRRIKALQGQDVWLARAKESAALREALLAQIPPANTPGAAQAALQSWLQSLANSTSDPQKVRTAVEGTAPVEALPGVVRLRATLRGGMSPREALNIARQVEGGRDLVVIESLDIRSDSNPNASIGMNAYYRLPASGAGAQP